jgi:hypothetical protein
MNRDDERWELARRYTDGTATAEETRTLETALLGDAALRREFARYLNVDTALAELALLPAPKAKIVRFPVPWRWVFAAAAAVVAALAAWQWMLPQVELTNGVAPRFASAAPNGEWMGQSCTLESGWVELHFRRADASVVIEAPAQFKIEDAGTLRMTSGRVTAHVRDGRRGLRVLTPQTEVFDLGTRFAVDVSERGRSEVHVFDGKVEAARAGSAKRELLTANEALRFDASTSESREARTGTFVQPEEIRPLADALRAGQPGRWEQDAEALRRDPALLAWIGFDPHSSGIITQTEAQHVQGRFPGKDALEFVDAEDFARVNLSARTRALTLMTWVRLDRVAAERSGLFTAESKAGTGGVNWMVNPRGLMIFAMRDQPPAESSDTTQRPKSAVSVYGNLRVWTHLAVTYEADERRVRFFVDGQFDSEVHTPTRLDAVLGPAIIGNTKSRNHEDQQFFQRLSGRMDEFVILARALSATEIQTHYAAGNPYR